MIMVRANATVSTDGKLTVETVQVPAGIAPGKHEVVVQIDEPPTQEKKRPPIQFSSHDIGPLPEGVSFSREEIYDDD